MTNTQTRTLVKMYGNPIATLGTFPAGWYTQSQDANGNVLLSFFSSYRELLTDDMPDFTYWWDEFTVSESVELAYPETWSSLPIQEAKPTIEELEWQRVVSAVTAWVDKQVAQINPKYLDRWYERFTGNERSDKIKMLRAMGGDAGLLATSWVEGFASLRETTIY